MMLHLRMDGLSKGRNGAKQIPCGNDRKKSKAGAASTTGITRSQNLEDIFPEIERRKHPRIAAVIAP